MDFTQLERIDKRIKKWNASVHAYTTKHTITHHAHHGINTTTNLSFIFKVSINFGLTLMNAYHQTHLSIKLTNKNLLTKSIAKIKERHIIN
ncbi:hypothetical protein CICLE_v10006328mg [Citrus x clementina]|uniref:Uncharacterized protein n=1 Tax=Citrus clementina TaxID=85681 RepID=V4S3U7_CITCL|nr:hypothetical protein CICLE_v10006328mg [Citrus x clementina]